MPKIRINDQLELHYEESGAGRPIVFVHGVWMSGRYFHRQLPALGQNHHAIALDLRGHGQSSHTEDGHTMATYAQDLRAFLKAMGLKDVVLAGWSMGCMVIWDYFKQFGDENVAAAIFTDQSPSDFKWPDWPAGIFDLPALVHLMSEVQTGREKVYRDFIPMLFKEPPAAADVEWMVAENMRLPASIASAVLFAQTMQDYRADLAKVNVPSLVIAGGMAGKMLSTVSVRFAHENIPGSQFSIFEDSNHCPFFEESERFNREVGAFVQSL